MEGPITDEARSTMVRAALARVGREEMQAALASMSDPRLALPKGVRNALNALRRHRDPVDAVGRAPYRGALPYVASAIGDACLARTIEELGEASDDPTREQLLAALDRVGDSFSDVTVAVMLASVADGGMPASDLCFDILAGDPRFGLTDLSDFSELDRPTGPRNAAQPTDRVVTPEQRQARRLKKQKDAEERRNKVEATRRAGEQVRRTRKQGRSGPLAGSDPPPGGARSGIRAAPRLTRRAALTPLQERDFDREDPWAAGVVFAWVPFDSVDAVQSDLEGKSRRCVVVAGSPTHLLVRPGYSVGGMKSRDWKSVPLRHWKQAGFDRPTWIDTESLRVPRERTQAPVGWLTPEDWNALW